MKNLEKLLYNILYTGGWTHTRTHAHTRTHTLRGDAGDDRMYHIRFSDRNLSNDCFKRGQRWNMILYCTFDVCFLLLFETVWILLDRYSGVSREETENSAVLHRPRLNIHF